MIPERIGPVQAPDLGALLGGAAERLTPTQARRTGHARPAPTEHPRDATEMLPGGEGGDRARTEAADGPEREPGERPATPARAAAGGRHARRASGPHGAHARRADRDGFSSKLAKAMRPKAESKDATDGQTAGGTDQAGPADGDGPDPVEAKSAAPAPGQTAAQTDPTDAAAAPAEDTDRARSDGSESPADAPEWLAYIRGLAAPATGPDLAGRLAAGKNGAEAAPAPAPVPSARPDAAAGVTAVIPQPIAPGTMPAPAQGSAQDGPQAAALAGGTGAQGKVEVTPPPPAAGSVAAQAPDAFPAPGPAIPEAPDAARGNAAPTTHARAEAPASPADAASIAPATGPAMAQAPGAPDGQLIQNATNFTAAGANPAPAAQAAARAHGTGPAAKDARPDTQAAADFQSRPEAPNPSALRAPDGTGAGSGEPGHQGTGNPDMGGQGEAGGRAQERDHLPLAQAAESVPAPGRGEADGNGPRPVQGAAGPSFPAWMHAGPRAAAEAATPRAESAVPRQIIQHVQSLRFTGLQSVAAGKDEIHIQLAPEHLGQVRISLEMRDGSLDGKITVADEHVRRAVEASLPDLRQAMENQGLKLGGLDVSVDQRQSGLLNPDGQGAESFFQRRGQGGDGPARDPLAAAELPDPADGRSDTGRRLGYNTLEFIG